MATPSGSEEVIKVVQAVQGHVPDVLEKTFMWLTGLLGLFGIGRKGVMMWSKTSIDLKLDQAIKNRIDALTLALREQAERITVLEEALVKLREVELQGASDVALVGVWVEALEQRECSCIKDNVCCATRPTEKLSTIYGRMVYRREVKDAIFANKPIPEKTERKKKPAKEPTEKTE